MTLRTCKQKQCKIMSSENKHKNVRFDNNKEEDGEEQQLQDEEE